MVRDKFKRYAQDVRAASDQVMEQIRTRLSDMPSGQTLVVNLGENHWNANHVMVGIEVARALKKEGVSFVSAGEIPVNTIDQYVAGNRPDGSAPGLRQFFSQSDNQQQRASLSAAAYPHMVHRIPLSKALYAHVLNRQGTSSYAVDVPRTDDHASINIHDAGALKSVREAGKLLGLNPSSVIAGHPKTTGLDYAEGSMTTEQENIGVVARNIHMKEACDQLSENIDGVRVILLRTGMMHVAGDREADIGYNGSLADLYADDPNAHYLGVNLYHGDGERDKVLWQEADDNSDICYAMVPCGEAFYAKTSPQWDGKDEAKHIAQLSKHLGNKGDLRLPGWGRDTSRILEVPARVKSVVDEDITALIKGGALEKRVPEPIPEP